jgi:predicted RNase H-like HicB family nuclease
MTGPFTAVFAQGDGKIIAYIEELPATYAEGATIEDARVALIVELALTLAANRRETHQDFAGARVVHREVLTVRGRP